MRLDLGSSVNKNALDESKSYDFFDPVAYKPVSMEEKVAGLGISKQLVTIDKAYFQAVTEARGANQLVQSKKESINQMLESVDERVRAINLNYAECHEAIMDAQAKAMKDLENITKQKLEALLSVEVQTNI